jgi:transcriptional regulator with XRE-family HTH domain
MILSGLRLVNQASILRVGHDKAPDFGDGRLSTRFASEFSRMASPFTVSRKMNAATTPHPVDKHVGERVRRRRLMLQMSQQTLARKLTLTFPQVQKYEKGTNRIGASRLHQISEILGVPVSFLFEGLPGPKSRLSRQRLPQYLVEFMQTAQGKRLVEALHRISDKKLRSHIVQLVETIAENQASIIARSKKVGPA